MNSFTLKNTSLHAENVSLNQISEEFGTPCYVYSKSALTKAFKDFSAGFAGTNHLVCFAVKANPSIAILNLFARLGAGFNIVSGGELARVLAAGGDPKKIVFSGVGKTEVEMQAALNAGIFIKIIAHMLVGHVLRRPRILLMAAVLLQQLLTQ